MQNYLVFQPIQRYFKRAAGAGDGNYIYYWKSKGLPDERSNSIKTPDYGITPYLSYYDTNKVRVKFDGTCLKQDQGTLLHGGIVKFTLFMVITFIIGNLKDYLMKEVILLKHLIMELLHT